MPTVYVQVQCLAADKAAIEADLSAFGSYPLNTALVPYPGDPAEPASNFGANISCVLNGGLYAALVALPANYPGCTVQVVQTTSPYYRAFNSAVHWTGWLNGQGLQVQVLTP